MDWERMDVWWFVGYISLGVLLIAGVLLIYKALRKCYKCIRNCANDYDPEIATGHHVPHHVPSGTAVTARTGAPGLVPYYWPDYRPATTFITPNRVPCGTATTRATGPTAITTRRYPERAATSTTSPCLCTGVITGVVTYVGDGDGFRLFHSCPGRAALDDTLSIRLAGIDAPEMGKKQKTQGQPYSKEAKAYLLKLICRKTLFLEKLGVDQYGRILAMAYLPDPQNANRTTLTADNNVNLEMVTRGLACVYTGRDAEYGKYEQNFRKAEAEAKILKKGMWAADGNIVTPMEYKKQQRACQPQPIFVA